MDMHRHQTPRLDELGSEGGMEKRGTTEERYKAARTRGGTSRTKYMPVRRELLGTKVHIIHCAVDLLEVESVNTGEKLGEEGKLTGVEVGNKRVKGTGIPGT